MEIGARKRTRTSTPLRELRPERSASANSAIRALVRAHPDLVGMRPEMYDAESPGATHNEHFDFARRHPLCQRNVYARDVLRASGFQTLLHICRSDERP